MNWSAVAEILNQQPAFRQKQVIKAIFSDLISDWNQIFTLPRELRAHLAQVCPLEIPAAVSVGRDQQTEKALITLSDGLKVETVLMRHHSGRMTVCVSSQIGCPLKCAFCATGQLGFKRNLTAGEIIVQVLFFARRLKAKNERVNNIVFMGMGEPFLNYAEVWRAIRIFNHPDGLKIGARHISISTVGIPDGIRQMAAENLQVNLAISLHAPTDELRRQIMPVAQNYLLKEIFSAVNFYLEKTNRRVMFEYLLLKGVNDSEAHARQLADLLSRFGRKSVSPSAKSSRSSSRLHSRTPARPSPAGLYMVNILTYNPACGFEPSTAAATERFLAVLAEQGVAATKRASLGGAIDAACGQLAGSAARKG